MGLRALPRLYFQGEISWDTGVTNNNPQVFDPESVRLLVPEGMSIAEFKRELPAASAAAGSWNHFGTHAARLENVEITGCALEGHGPIVVDDPIVGANVELEGKLVDLDAAATSSAQIFFDHFRIGNNTLGMAAERDRRIHASFINFRRNLGGLPSAGNAGAVWHTSFSTEALQFSGDDSPALLALSEAVSAAEGSSGVYVRFHTYRTLYWQNGIKNDFPERPENAGELAGLYRQGLNFSNPAYSKVIGVMGVWKVGESGSECAGRPVLPVQAGFGPAFVEFDGTRSGILDLGQTIPELDIDLAKVDLGPISLVLRDQQGELQLAEFTAEEYAQDQYEAAAGLLEFRLSENLDGDLLTRLNHGNLDLRVRSAGQVVSILSEPDYYSQVGVRNLYLDQQEALTLELDTFSRGRRPDSTVQVQVSEYDRSGTLLQVLGVLPVGVDGMSLFELSAATEPGFRSYLFQPYEGNSPPQPAPSLTPLAHAYANVRTLPFDDELNATMSDDEISWDWIYENILSTYDALNPVMGRRERPAIGLSLDHQQTVEASVSLIRDLVDESNFESARYMPVTRDMSSGKRRLLQRWCDLALANSTPSSDTKRTIELTVPDDIRVNRRVEEP
jgi:hypothetical protein